MIHTALQLLRAAAGLHRSGSTGRRAGPLRIARVLLPQAVEAGERLRLPPLSFHNTTKLPLLQSHTFTISVFPNTITLIERQNSTSAVMALQLAPALNNACLGLLVHTNRVHGGRKG